jgi:glycerophosphoryl diester phosphodiesterase
LKFTKKATVCIAVFAVVLVVLSFLFYATNKKIQPVETVKLSESGIVANDETLRLIAQGGLSGISPENTYFAVEKAGREGFTAVEMDVRETLDGVWVLMRDSTINKMTDGRGKINNRTYFELLNFTVDNGANIKDYPDTRIAALEDVLDLCAKYGIRPYINIAKSSDAGLEKLAAIFAFRADTQNISVLSSDRDLLQQFKILSPATGLWYVSDRLSDSKMKWLEENKEIGIVFHAGKKSNTDEKIDRFVKAGIKITCRDVSDTDTIKRMVDLGIKSFYTDRILPK